MPTPNDPLFSTKSYTECPLFLFSGRHLYVTFIFLVPPPGPPIHFASEVNLPAGKCTYLSLGKNHGACTRILLQVPSKNAVVGLLIKSRHYIWPWHLSLHGFLFLVLFFHCFFSFFFFSNLSRVDLNWKWKAINCYVLYLQIPLLCIPKRADVLNINKCDKSPLVQIGMIMKDMMEFYL